MFHLILESKFQHMAHAVATKHHPGILAEAFLNEVSPFWQ